MTNRGGDDADAAVGDDDDVDDDDDDDDDRECTHRPEQLGEGFLLLEARGQTGVRLRCRHLPIQRPAGALLA